MRDITEIFTAKAFDELRNHLLGNEEGQEEAAVLIAGVVETPRELRLLVREVVPVPDACFLHKSSGGLQIHPDFLSLQLKRCRSSGCAFILAHSHPFSTRHVGFSCIDDAGERDLFPKVLSLNEGLPAGTIVMSRQSLAARVWLRPEDGPRTVDEVRVLGETIMRFGGNDGCHLPRRAAERPDEVLYSRQILAIGIEGQRLLQQTRVAIVGVGGLGSSIFAQLVHLGVHDIVLVDEDVVDKSNLARMVGAVERDIGVPKVEVLRRLGLRFDSRLAIDTVENPVESTEAQGKLRDVDVIFCCVDTLPGREFVNRFGCRYYIPVIDSGCDIQMSGDTCPRVRAIGGRVMVLMPDGPCLHCYGMATADILRGEGLAQCNKPAHREKKELPSMICHVGVVASLAVCEFVNLVTGMAPRKKSVYHVYDGINGVVRECRGERNLDCPICGKQRGLGDRLALVEGNSSVARTEAFCCGEKSHKQ